FLLLRCGYRSRSARGTHSTCSERSLLCSASLRLCCFLCIRRLGDTRLGCRLGRLDILGLDVLGLCILDTCRFCLWLCSGLAQAKETPCGFPCSSFRLCVFGRRRRRRRCLCFCVFCLYIFGL